MDYATRTQWRFKTVEGVHAVLDVLGARMEGAEIGLMPWLITVDDKHYQALVPESDFNTKYMTRFIQHFRFCPQWREHFRTDLPTHPKVEVVLITGNVFMVDKAVARCVSLLCDEGYTVIDSRQGDMVPHGRSGYLKFAGDIPEALESAAQALGWLNLDRSIEPVIPRGWAHEYNQMFHLLLDDWLHGDVDSTGDRYHLYREPLPFVPDWPVLPPAALAEHERKVRKDVERVNRLDTRASFHDLVSLTSGRDTYSRMNLERLKAASAEDPFLEHLEGIITDPAGLARALRWRLRGLQLDLVLRKSEIEAALNKRDEKRREQYKIHAAQDIAHV